MAKRDITKRKKGEVIREAQIEGQEGTSSMRTKILWLVALFGLFVLLGYLIFD